MKVLILGGKEFLGRHIVRACLQAGHELTLFNRGRTNPELYAEIETILGDRETELEKLKAGRWDVVIDCCAYVPDNVAETARVLADRCQHYIFISSCSVYNMSSNFGHRNENAELVSLTLDEANVEPRGKDYGACKYLCERAVDENFPGKITHIRPGLIVGPYDPTARFPYWIQKLLKGGVTLAPGEPQFPVQFIDARDLAQWCAKVATHGITGVFNATGPSAEPVSMGAFLNLANQTLGERAQFQWVPEEFLRAQGVNCWSELPLWVYRELELFVSWDSTKAIEQGLKFRPMAETVLDTADWLKHVELSSLKGQPMELNREIKLLQEYERSLHGENSQVL